MAVEILILFILQEITISGLFLFSTVRATRRLRWVKNPLLKKMNIGVSLLGIGVAIRSVAIFVPAPLALRVILWQIGELIFLGAWHFMFNHNFRDIHALIEVRPDAIYSELQQSHSHDPK